MRHKYDVGCYNIVKQMEFFEALKSRHSIRTYQDKPVEESKLKSILEAANSAPSAGNLQAYEIFVVKDGQKKKLLSRAANDQDWITEAPIVLVFCSNPSRSSRKYGTRGEKLYSLQDATIAASYAQLAAHTLDLGVCWVGAFDEKDILKILGNPKSLIPVVIMPIGYPAGKPEITGRRRLDDISHEI